MGRSPGPSVKALASAGIFVTGEVDRVEPYYQQTSVAVAPLRAGSGSRLKILEAMALGRPVVSTTLGAEGLDAEPGKHLLIADDVEGFANQIIGLIQTHDRRRKMAAEAREFVEQHHDWESIAARQLEIYGN